MTNMEAVEIVHAAKKALDEIVAEDREVDARLVEAQQALSRLRVALFDASPARVVSWNDNDTVSK